MGRRDRIVAAALAAAFHLLVFAPTIGASSSLLDSGFQPEAAAIEGGALPYSDRDFEYPPLAIPLILLPAWLSGGPAGYEVAFELEMLAFDLTIVALLAFGLRQTRERVWAALAVYSAGLLALSGVLLPDSAIESAPLSLARFDLVPAALTLGAVLARLGSRSATWSALLATGVAVKAFPAVLYPPLLRDERRPGRVAVATAIPLAAAAAIVIAPGDEFASAIGYHSGRALQVETVGATPLMIAHLLFGLDARFAVGGGSFNLIADGAGLVRALSIAIVLAGTALLLWRAWVVRPPLLIAATALIAVGVAFAPVLSPQFMLWILPLSAAAWGLRTPNLILLAALGLTQMALHYYSGVATLEPHFVWTIAARNALLLAYVALVVRPLLQRDGRRDDPVTG